MEGTTNVEAYKFWSGTLKYREHLENLGVGGRIKLKWIFRRGFGLIQLAYDRNQ
jgi:hypothetical protein